MPLAYIDAGSGSMILQVILGGLGGVGVAVKLLGQRMRGRVGGSAQERTEPARAAVAGTTEEG